MIHKLILRQARSLAASMAFYQNSDDYLWDELSIYDKADIYNAVIAFYSKRNPNNVDDLKNWVGCMSACMPDMDDAWALDSVHNPYPHLYNTLMRTTACLAHLEAPVFLELFDVEFEGDEVKATLKPDVAWDWATPEDFN